MSKMNLTTHADATLPANVMHSCSRATAVIGRAIEALPVFMSAAIPAALALTHPTAIGETMSQADVSMLLAELTSGRH